MSSEILTQDFWSIDPMTMLAIAGMALVTYGTRVGGWFAVRRMVLSGRTRAAMDAVPGAVLASVIAPMVIATGAAETGAAIVTVLTFLVMPRLVAIIAGIVAVVALRALIG